MNKAVFFDRDGVVNIRVVGEYISKAEDFVFWSDFIAFFKKIKDKGLQTYLITNQQGIGKGVMSIEQLNTLHAYMQEELMKKTGHQFDDIFYCTALAKDNNRCRKPNPGMLLDAADKYDIDLEKSWFIGDSPSDAIAGKRANCKTILIGNENDIPTEADYHFSNFNQIDVI